MPPNARTSQRAPPRPSGGAACPKKGGGDPAPYHKSAPVFNSLRSPRIRLEELKDDLQMALGRISEAAQERLAGSELISFISCRETLDSPRQIGEFGAKLHERINKALNHSTAEDLGENGVLGVELVKFGRLVEKLLSDKIPALARSVEDRLESIRKKQRETTGPEGTPENAAVN